MKVEVRIEGIIEVDDDATEEQIQEAVEFSIGYSGSMSLDNAVGMDLEWDNCDVEINL